MIYLVKWNDGKLIRIGGEIGIFFSPPLQNNMDIYYSIVGKVEISSDGVLDLSNGFMLDRSDKVFYSFLFY